jgi:NAD(P)-dependent dehydrogenase (short-subunit alcohol dehydrogenase family)
VTQTVAVVTGGSRGIGEADVRRLTRRGNAVLLTCTSDETGGPGPCDSCHDRRDGRGAIEWLTGTDAGYVTGAIIDIAGGVR